MAEVPSPEREGDPWDQLILGSHVLPGIWTVSGVAARRIDVKSRKGSDGGFVADKGYELAPITLTGNLSPEDEWEEFASGPLKQIHPRRKGAARDPLAIVHPACAALGISTVIVVRVHTPRSTREGVIQEIECREWMPGPKVVKKKKPLPQGFTDQPGGTLGRVVRDGETGEIIDPGIPPPSLRPPQPELNESLTFVFGEP